MNKTFQQLPDEQRERQSRPVSISGQSSAQRTMGMSTAFAFAAVVQFSLWSLRRRIGQIVPVGSAFLLLVCTMQSIGALHDTSSVLTRQKIAQHWRTPYDLYVRPQSAVSQPERSAGWIDPQSVLEDYGGISAQQLASIGVLPHVVQVIPFANIGWQSVDVQVPLALLPQGIYRITATWIGQGIAGSEIVRYVDVTDLAHLTSEMPPSSPVMVHLIARDDKTPVVFSMSVQAIQDVIGIPTAQKAALSQVLFENMPPATAVHLSLHVDKLLGAMAALPACMQRSACWQARHVLLLGAMQYQVNSVQLLRFSRTNYSATPQQLAQGQVAVASIGADIQGQLYRTPLATHVAIPANAGSEDMAAHPQLAPLNVLPLSGPEHLPLMPNAARFISLEQACAINGASCYSGLYVRLTGVEGYSQQSLALLQATAAAIAAHTGLHVDILDGSSIRSVSLSTSANSPTLVQSSIHGVSLSTSADAATLVQSSWRVVGVAVQIVHGVDALQATLLVLCSIVCLLAIGAAGALVGIGRRKDALLLQQLGWPLHLLLCIFALDALILCLPGGLLSISWLQLTSTLWPISLSPAIIWILLLAGLIAYSCTLISIACLRTTRTRPLKVGTMLSGAGNFVQETGPIGSRRGGSGVDEERGRLRRPGAGRVRPREQDAGDASVPSQPSPTPAPTERCQGSCKVSMAEASTATTIRDGYNGHSGYSSGAQPHAGNDKGSLRHARLHPLLGLATALERLFPALRQFSSVAMPACICSLAVTSATFLIAIEYVLVASFNQVLVVTVLGKQVREALEVPQLLLLLLLLGAALLTVALCVTLMLRGRREEIALLSMLGWEHRAVLLRLTWDCCWPALLSGEVGGILVLGVTLLGGALPPFLIIAGLLLCTPLAGVLLVSLAAIAPAWRETKRVFSWR